MSSVGELVTLGFADASFRYLSYHSMSLLDMIYDFNLPFQQHGQSTSQQLNLTLRRDFMNEVTLDSLDKPKTTIYIVL
jgi:hypothetical protein